MAAGTLTRKVDKDPRLIINNCSKDDVEAKQLQTHSRRTAPHRVKLYNCNKRLPYFKSFYGSLPEVPINVEGAKNTHPGKFRFPEVMCDAYR